MTVNEINIEMTKRFPGDEIRIESADDFNSEYVNTGIQHKYLTTLKFTRLATTSVDFEERNATEFISESESI